MKIGPTHLVHYRSRPWFPFALLSIGVLSTFFTAFYMDRVADSKDRLLFSKEMTQIKQAVDKRLDIYIALLLASQGSMLSQRSVSRVEFEQYVSLLELQDRYPGIQGIGYASAIAPTEVSELEASMAEQGITDFRVHPVGERDLYSVVTYLAPLDESNRARLGYDMFSEKSTREAMELARDRGQPATSGKVANSFLIFVPVYRDPTLTTVEERKANLKGFIYSTFIAKDFFVGIFGNTTNYDVDLYVFDGKKIKNDALLYSRNGRQISESQCQGDKSSTSTLIVANRPWTLCMMPNNLFSRSTERSLIPFILVGGFIFSFILYLLSRMQYIARLKAEQLAVDLYNSKEALRESEGILRRMIHASVIGVVFFDIDGTITGANDAFWKMAGYNKIDIRKRYINFFKMTPEEYQKLDQKALKEARKSGSYKSYEKEMTRKDKTRLPVLIALAHIKRPREQMVGMVVDLTDRKRLEQQKDEFISIASHELKTPVTSLKAYAQVMTKKFKQVGDKTSAQQLEKMDSQLDRLTNLIKHLLDVTKIQAGKLIFKEEFFDANDLVKDTVEEMQRTTEKHAIELVGKVNYPLYGDRERIEQVIINLLSNAIKYSPDADKIIVTISENNKNITVCIKDFGVGIPPDMREKVFDRFFRVSGNREETYPGLGLGLYISSEIIKRQRGKIWVESQLGKGSQFCFSLPVQMTPEAKNQKKTKVR